MPADGLLRDALRVAVRQAPGGQRAHWAEALASRADRFGSAPSAPARAAAERFLAAGARDLLELGAG